MPRHIAINLVVGTSAIVAILAVVLWARSFRNEYALEFDHRGEPRRAWIKSGVIGVDNAPAIQIAKFRAQRDLWVASRLERDMDLIVLPPARIPARWSRSSATLLPSAIVLLALAPMLRLREAWRVRVRRAAGLCPACGYDVRATPQRCPECGQVQRS